MIRSKIVSECQSFPRLLPQVAALSEAELARFAEGVDEFSFPLAEWLRALDWFLDWEQSTGRSIPLPDKIEYLMCCAQGSIQNGHLVSLPDLLQDYVRLYGVEPR